MLPPELQDVLADVGGNVRSNVGGLLGAVRQRLLPQGAPEPHPTPQRPLMHPGSATFFASVGLRNPLAMLAQQQGKPVPWAPSAAAADSSASEEPAGKTGSEQSEEMPTMIGDLDPEATIPIAAVRLAPAVQPGGRCNPCMTLL